MAYFIDKPRVLANAGLKAQFLEVDGMRRLDQIRQERKFAEMKAAGMAQNAMLVNAAMFPQEIYTELDTVTKELMLDDDGMTLLNDLEGLSKNVNIGKIIAEYRRYDAKGFEARTSLDGQHSKPVGRGSHNFDGTLVPVHSTGIGASWREYEGMRTAGFDQLIDDQRFAVRTIRERMSLQLMEGSPDLEFKGRTALGIKNSDNVLAFDITTQVTGGTLLTGPNGLIRDAFRAVINALLANNNNAVGKVDFYLSPEIYARMSEIYVAVDGSGQPVVLTNQETVLDVLKRLPDVGEIKKDTNFTGDEFTAGVRRAEYIQPVVGMPVTTVPIERRHPQDEHQLLVWCAFGVQIKADADGRSGWLYAKKA